MHGSRKGLPAPQEIDSYLTPEKQLQERRYLVPDFRDPEKAPVAMVRWKKGRGTGGGIADFCPLSRCRRRSDACCSMSQVRVWGGGG